MNAASHRYVPLSGSAKDRRRRVRALKRAFPLRPLDAIDARQPYLTVGYGCEKRQVMITTPGR